VKASSPSSTIWREDPAGMGNLIASRLNAPHRSP